MKMKLIALVFALIVVIDTTIAGGYGGGESGAFAGSSAQSSSSSFANSGGNGYGYGGENTGNAAVGFSDPHSHDGHGGNPFLPGGGSKKGLSFGIQKTINLNIGGKGGLLTGLLGHGSGGGSGGCISGGCGGSSGGFYPANQGHGGGNGGSWAGANAAASANANAGAGSINGFKPSGHSHGGRGHSNLGYGHGHIGGGSSGGTSHHGINLSINKEISSDISHSGANGPHVNYPTKHTLISGGPSSTSFVGAGGHSGSINGGNYESGIPGNCGGKPGGCAGNSGVILNGGYGGKKPSSYGGGPIVFPGVSIHKEISLGVNAGLGGGSHNGGVGNCGHQGCSDGINKPQGGANYGGALPNSGFQGASSKAFADSSATSTSFSGSGGFNGPYPSGNSPISHPGSTGCSSGLCGGAGVGCSTGKCGETGGLPLGHSGSYSSSSSSASSSAKSGSWSGGGY